MGVGAALNLVLVVLVLLSLWHGLELDPLTHDGATGRWSCPTRWLFSSQGVFRTPGCLRGAWDAPCIAPTPPGPAILATPRSHPWPLAKVVAEHGGPPRPLSGAASGATGCSLPRPLGCLGEGQGPVVGALFRSAPGAAGSVHPCLHPSVRPSVRPQGFAREMGAALGRQPRGEGEEAGTKTRRRGQLLPFSRLKRRRGPFRPRPPPALGGQSRRPWCPPSAQGLEKSRTFIFSLCLRSPGAARRRLCCFLLPLRPCLCMADRPAAFPGGG